MILLLSGISWGLGDSSEKAISYSPFQVHINDNFAKFSEALFIADRHAREEVRERALMQQRLASKEKASKEENLRLLAQQAREQRSGIAPSIPVGGSGAGAGGGGEGVKAPAVKGMALGGYGSGSDSESGDDDSDSEGEKESDEDTEEARERDKIRREKRQEREKEMRLNNMGSETRAKILMR